MDLKACGSCGKLRPWINGTPPRYENSTLLEDLRSALVDWFDDRPKVRRPAAIDFSVATQFDDGPAWATWDTTAYFTDSLVGTPYGEDFQRSFVSEALVELSDFEQPQAGDLLRVVIPPPFTEPDDTRSTEYAYTVSEYAQEAAIVLGEGWGSESGYIGAYEKLWRPGVPRLRVFVDEYDDLVVVLDDDADPMRFTVDLPNGAPSLPYELRAVAEELAEIIRANYL